MHLKGTDPDGYLYQAYLNGELLPMCLEANEEEGWALVNLPDPERPGSMLLEPVLGGYAPVVRRVEGKIELRLIERNTIQKQEDALSASRGFDRRGNGEGPFKCRCEWSSRVHGATCPEHGQPGIPIPARL